MDYKSFLGKLNFVPKENAIGVFIKKYPQAGGYAIEVDFEKQEINYGSLIKADSKTTQNFSQQENFVVLECVNRLLEKGYKPKNITLEKTYPAGHRFSGRLDICVTRPDGSEYLLIECKTFGKAFNEEFVRMKKDGGQLFTYFKFSNKPDVIMLYTSNLEGKKIDFENQIVKIKDDYRTGDVKDFYEKWNKLPNKNGIFEDWVQPYCFESKALTIEDLKEIESEDSSLIFNHFLEILRHNVVSDKPNAFNKIFTLFLCKILDEKKTKPKQELAFQWFNTPYKYDGVSYPPDDHISFQKRLTDLYKKGMKEFLSKEVTDISDADFDRKYGDVNDATRRKILDDLTEIRLKKNNEFAIKEVFDDDSFNENAKVVKEVVELLQGYKIRYSAKQQYLSDFFEQLLTTGLKQESGQFFTPVPVAQFIIKSLPIDEILQDKLKNGIKDECLPYIIDYAAGSGHFITESMHELQRLLENCDSDKFFGEAKDIVDVAKARPYNWAFDYVYGIEKDYRLVKVGKVGCYLHGDGLANVIHSDGLGSFKDTKEYKELLKKSDKDFPKENKQFDIVVSNPPYSVSAFKNNASKYYSKKDFELYDYLTDNSSEIECLFVERAKQLLRDGGVAGVILPSSILSNEGIYTKAREMIVQYFEIVAITELGGNTFMATNTNTVVLFLRRRNNYDTINLQKSIEHFFEDWQDVTRNGIEKPIAKYVNHVWDNISFKDYITMLKKEPNDKIISHEIYKEYRKKLKPKTEDDFWNVIIKTEKEKLLYFILAYPQQKVVIVKTGEKDAEKRFLGYEFSNRRGDEGIHPIQRGKNPSTGKEYTASDLTRLFDEEKFDNPEKASTYIHKAFYGEFPKIHESLKNNVFYANLIDMLIFDREKFVKNISLTVKKKVKIKSKWNVVKLGEVSQINYGTRIVKKAEEGTIYPVYGGGDETFRADSFNRKNAYIISRFGMSPECVRFVSGEFFLNDSGMTLDSSNVLLNQKYLDYYLYFNQELVYLCGRGVAQKNIDIEAFNLIPVPIPPKEIQQKIVKEIDILEKKEKKMIEKIEEEKKEIADMFNNYTKNKSEMLKLSDICEMKAGQFVKTGDIHDKRQEGLYPCYGGNGLRGYTKTYTHDGLYPLVGRQGALCGNVHLVKGKFHATEHALVVTHKKNIDRIWLYHKLISMNLNQYAKGTAQPGLSVENLTPIQISIPPLLEQQKIVSKIEKIETQIFEAQKIIDEIHVQKNNVLKKYEIC